MMFFKNMTRNRTFEKTIHSPVVGIDRESLAPDRLSIIYHRYYRSSTRVLEVHGA